METCIRGLSSKVRLTPLPLHPPAPSDLAVFLWIPLRILAKVSSRPIYPPTKMPHDGILHVAIRDYWGLPSSNWFSNWLWWGMLIELGRAPCALRLLGPPTLSLACPWAPCQCITHSYANIFWQHVYTQSSDRGNMYFHTCALRHTSFRNNSRTVACL